MDVAFCSKNGGIFFQSSTDRLTLAEGIHVCHRFKAGRPEFELMVVAKWFVASALKTGLCFSRSVIQELDHDDNSDLVS